MFLKDRPQTRCSAHRFPSSIPQDGLTSHPFPFHRSGQGDDTINDVFAPWTCTEHPCGKPLPNRRMLWALRRNRNRRGSSGHEPCLGRQPQIYIIPYLPDRCQGFNGLTLIAAGRRRMPPRDAILHGCTEMRERCARSVRFPAATPRPDLSLTLKGSRYTVSDLNRQMR